jgi:Family of unknown function (DUF5999)
MTVSHLSDHRRTDSRRPQCPHEPQCPLPDAPDHVAARTVVSHPGQGWSLLCNGVVVFDDMGEILPDRLCIAPRRPERQRRAA